MALYLADDGVTPVTTHSMMKAFRQCHREAYYKYVLRLQPKVLSKPLTRGKWFHALLEAYLLGDDWRHIHKVWCGRYAKLFDEEKDRLGNLPTELLHLMESYIWHYKKDPWEVIDTEVLVEALLPNGHLFRGKVDVLIRDHTGDLWAGDHKTHKRLPDWDFRMLDEQSTLYYWALRENGLPVRGFMWNYITTEKITTPKVVVKGDRFYRRSGSLSPTDYPTLVRTLQDLGALVGGKLTDVLNPTERALVKEDLRYLRAQQFESEDSMQTSPFFRRDYLVKTDDLVDRVLASTVRTSEEMHAYDFTSSVDAIPRNTSACSKSFMCQYRSLSLTDLVTGDSKNVQRREYMHGDPLAYYGDEEEGMME